MKKSGSLLPDQAIATRLQAQIRALEALQAILARGRRDTDTVEIGPGNTGRALPTDRAPSRPSLSAPWWPSELLPKDGLRPPTPVSCYQLRDSNVPTIGVLLFGLGGQAIANAVAQVSQRQRSGMNFIPVFFTDVPTYHGLRRYGHIFEYFPGTIFGPTDDFLGFREKFAFAWKKWNIKSFLDMSPASLLRERLGEMDIPFEISSRQKAFDPTIRKPPLPPVPTPDIVSLKASYFSAGLDAVSDNFVLYRILGNDLYPRHQVGQTASNVRFILENERPLPDCQKRWIVNRIIDPEQEAGIIYLLEKHRQPYIHIPFDLDEYSRREWEFDSFPQPAFFLRGPFAAMDDYDRSRAEVHARRHKNNYVMNNNGARNAALRDGRSRAKWILPWDGNCFLTDLAWQELKGAVTARPYMKYFVVPMARTVDNQFLLDSDVRPEALDEPQLLFRQDALEEFDEAFPYGRRPKVEMLWRLGVPGNWDNWYDDLWDLPRPRRSDEAGEFAVAGWVARLSSGQADLETSAKHGLKGRGLARIEAITATLDQLDETILRSRFDPQCLTAYDERALAGLSADDLDPAKQSILDRLVQEADIALARGPYSVTDKTSLPPSGDSHDYWHMAPYWWPNPNTPDGLPYIYRDGERAPGTRLYEPDSDRYDRTRLQRLFDDTTILALAWAATGEPAYANRGAELVRHWFIAPASRMNPHLRYAQMQPGQAEGLQYGVIEMKDLYYFLDAVRLLSRSSAFGEEDDRIFREWLVDYLGWLRTSPQGMAERKANNNHGTCFDLQTAAIAAYLGDAALLVSTFRTARERILEQFDEAGRQPQEIKRTQTAHYCCFNLQSWMNLATLAARCGDDLRSYRGCDGRGLQQAYNWLLPFMEGAEWPHLQIESFDTPRFAALYHACALHFGGLSKTMPDRYSLSPIYFPHDGIMPFWILGENGDRTSLVASPLLLARDRPKRLPAPYISLGSNETSPIDALLDKTDREIDRLGKIRTSSEAPPLIFSIPLKSKITSPDWTEVEELLDQTLSTALAQTDDNFFIYVAGHEKPAIASIDHPKVVWLPVGFDPPASPQRHMADRNAKRLEIAVKVGALQQDCLFMPLDADDWVHCRTVEFMRKKGFETSKLLGRGFIANLAASSVWLDSVEGRPFYKKAGASAAVFALRQVDFPNSTHRRDVEPLKFSATLSRHTDFAQALERATMPYEIVGLPLATYVRGHTNNDTVIRSGAESNNYVDRHAEPISDRFKQSFVFKT